MGSCRTLRYAVLLLISRISAYLTAVSWVINPAGTLMNYLLNSASDNSNTIFRFVLTALSYEMLTFCIWDLEIMVVAFSHLRSLPGVPIGSPPRWALYWHERVA